MTNPDDSPQALARFDSLRARWLSGASSEEAAMKNAVLGAALCSALISIFPNSLRAEDGGTAELYYQSHYFLAGFLLRSSAVCKDDSKGAITAGFGLLSGAEFKTISKAYPKTIAQWMGEGATNFNNGVMTDGVLKACEYAITMRHKAQELSTEK